MSELHSETNNSPLGLKVRIKLVDLEPAHKRAHSSREAGASRHISHGCLSAIAGHSSPRTTKSPSQPEPIHARPEETPRFEICSYSGDRIPVSDFEAHLEYCRVCANRVELQLDFIEALEAAVYQRLDDPESKRVHGAMLISAPELNFAVCGEIEMI